MEREKLHFFYIKHYCPRNVHTLLNAMKCSDVFLRSVLLMIPIVGVMVSLTALSGIGMFAYYTKTGCDPIKGGMIKNANQVTTLKSMEH